MPSSSPISSVMTTDVVTLRSDQPLSEAADVLSERGIGAAPVVDADGRCVGLLRDEDLLATEARLHLPTTIAIMGYDFTLPGAIRRYDDELKRALASQVGEVMEDEFPHLTPDATMEDAATLMHESDVSHVVVLDPAHHVAGIIARGDLIRYLARTT